ncbi:MAG TPA: ABC transporter permease [Dehalococcoidales bacterium]|nr:ABC transporter permease [Dehalococcoidales bacterium]
MTRFIVLRLIQAVFTVIGILVVVFFLLRLSGDPTRLLVSPTSSLEQLEAIRSSLGLDRSVATQFVIYMRDMTTGNLGTSFVHARPVGDMIREAFPNTLRLGLPSFIIGMLLALGLGILAATRRDTILDNGVKFLAVLGQALPGFWVAIMAVLIFSVTLGWVPAAGFERPVNYILPVAAQVFFMLPGMMRLVRSSMLDVLDSEYVKLARIKGLSERMVIWKHALRNALIAPLTTAGMIFAGLVGGAVIVEQIFNWPGMGRLIVTATFARDFPVVQAVTLIIAVMVVCMNLLVDITYAYIDPQIRYGKS